MSAIGQARLERSRCHGRGEAGETLVEFTLVLLVFILIIMGIVDLSRAVYARNAVASAAREGARYGIVHPSDPAGTAQAARRLLAGLDMSQLSVQVSYPDALHVQVEVTYRFQPVSALIGRYVDGGSGAGIILRSRSVMRRE